MQIVFGGDDAFSTAIAGLQSAENRNYFATQIENARNVIGERFGEFGQKFLSGAEKLYERFNSSNAIELAKATLNQMRGIFQSDIVRTIHNLEDFQIATPVMQRWVMANPLVRELYHKQQCDGYSDTYVDQEPTKIGKDHYDWRRVNNGMIEVDDNGGWTANQYADYAPNYEEELEISDQFRILDSWNAIENLILQGGSDPTSPWNNSL